MVDSLTQDVKFLQAFEGILPDFADLVFVETQLDDVGRQVCRDLRQHVVGEVQKSEVVHVSESFGVNLGNFIVVEKETLTWRERNQNLILFICF